MVHYEAPPGRNSAGNSWSYIDVVGTYGMVVGRPGQVVQITDWKGQRQATGNAYVALQWVSNGVLLTPAWRLVTDELFIMAAPGSAGCLFEGLVGQGMSLIITGNVPVAVKCNFIWSG